jgi:elongation factor P
MHVQPGRGAAFVRTKMRNLLTGNTNEKTFRSGEKFELAEVSRDVMQYTYMDGDDYMFMKMETFEELRVPPIAVSKFVK